MSESSIESRLLSLVRRIQAFDGGPEAHDALVAEFVRLAPYPQASDLIFHDDLTPEEIVQRALAYGATPLTFDPTLNSPPP